MKDKEKQMEEMAKVIDKDCDCCNCKNCDVLKRYKKVKGFDGICCSAIRKSEEIYEYLTKDSVVLSKEEYEKLLEQRRKARSEQKRFKRKYLYTKQELQQASEETAEKILKLVFKHITTPEVWEVLQQNTWLSKGGNFTANKHIWNLLLEPIAQQVGVEIKE